MNIQQHYKKFAPQSWHKKHISISWLAILMLAITGIMLYSFVIGRNIAEQYTPFVKATMEIKLKITIAHLWFEEIISGDKSIEIEDIFENLDQAEWYAQVILEGCENKRGKFIRINSPVLCNKIEQILLSISSFRAIARDRWETQSSSGIGSDIDRQFDMVFFELIKNADKIETILQQAIDKQLSQFHILQNILLVIVIILSVIIGIKLKRYEKNRINDIQALQDKEEKLRIILNSIGDALIVTNTDGCIILMNPVAEKLTGWMFKEALGKPLTRIFNIVNAHTGKKVDSPVNKVLQNGMVIGLANHTMLISKKGTEYQIADSGAPIKNIDGNISGVVLVFRDISEEYRMQKKIIDREERFSTFINNSTDATSLYDSNLNLIEINKSGLAMFPKGTKKEDIIGKSLFEMNPDFKDSERHKNYLKVIKTGIPAINENYIPHPKWGDLHLSVRVFKVGTGLGMIVTDVTKNKRSEELIQISEARLIEAQRIAQIGSWELNFVSNTLYWSDETYRIFGFKPKQFNTSYEIFIEIVHPDDKKLVDKTFTHSIKNCTPYEITHRLKLKNGTVKIVNERCETIFDETGKAILSIGTVQDITEQKNMENDLLESKARLNEAQKLAGLGYWSWNPETGDVFWSEEVYKIFCLEPAGFTPQIDSILELSPWPEENKRDQELIQKAVKKHEKGEYEQKFLRPDGSIGYYYSTFQGKYNNEKELVSIEGTIQDISKQKEMEIELKDAELRYRTVADFTYDWEYWENPDKSLNYVSPACVKVSGYSVEQFIKNPMLLNEIVVDEDKDIWNKHTHESSQQIQTEKEIQFRIKRKDGKLVWIEHVCRQVRDENNAFMGYRCSNRDINWRKQAEEKIKNKNKELENYLYVASHDLRSPLVNIQGFGQRLQKQTDTIKNMVFECHLDNKIRQDFEEITNKNIPTTLDFIFSNIAKMDTLINGLLQVSRTGKEKMDIKKIDMNSLTKKLIASHNFQLEDFKANINIEKLPGCYGDEELLSRLFANILSNALKYRDKERYPEISIKGKTIYNKVIYSVQDNGIGISESNLEKIWHVFYRIDPHSPEQGEGIGLSIVKQIIDKHKGKISVESKIDIGTTFFIELQKKNFSDNLSN